MGFRRAAHLLAAARIPVMAEVDVMAGVDVDVCAEGAARENERNEGI